MKKTSLFPMNLLFLTEAQILNTALLGEAQKQKVHLP